MKTIDKWCSKCKMVQPHFVWKQLFNDDSIFDRLIFGACTLGASEFVVDKYKQCHVCGKTKKNGK